MFEYFCSYDGTVDFCLLRQTCGWILQRRGMHPPADDNDAEADNNHRRSRHELQQLSSRRIRELGLHVGNMSDERYKES